MYLDVVRKEGNQSELIAIFNHVLRVWVGQMLYDEYVSKGWAGLAGTCGHCEGVIADDLFVWVKAEHSLGNFVGEQQCMPEM